LNIFGPYYNINHVSVSAATVYDLTTDGYESIVEGKKLFDDGQYDQASLYYWRAVLLQGSSSNKYTVEEAFQGFMSCYQVQDRAVDGLLFIAKESMQRKQKEMAIQYVNQALMLEPDNKEALFLKERFETGGAMGQSEQQPIKKRKQRDNKFQPEWGTPGEERRKTKQKQYSLFVSIYS
jgi:tetratricopeptide (TPR) repeat protein